MKEWKDATTGCRIRQLTEFEDGATRSYFRIPCALDDGRVVVTGASGGRSGIWLVDLKDGAIEPGPRDVHKYLTLQPGTGRCWFVRDREVWLADFSQGAEEAICRLPDDLKGRLWGITCDGRLGFGACANPPKGEPSIAKGTGQDADAKTTGGTRAQRHRLRAGGHLWTLDLKTAEVREIYEFHTAKPGHLQCSYTDPTLLRFCHEGPWRLLQRIWLIRTDGSDVHRVRPQLLGEAVGHEFWWPDGNAIGYKYVDRRKDRNTDDMCFLEYSGLPLQIGIAGLDGKERWLSEPMEHYQSHVNISPDERWFCGEGTHDWFFVSVARYEPTSRQLDFTPVATTHTPYCAGNGADINASFSPDSRWVIYNDEIDGIRQLCAVEVPEG